ncbi:MAG: DUF4230 domain-containing protein [Erysipelotrichaceae bacterium]|nr:DUF4230 domain-containing protein [Erysipelotrichaceae bacterium]
MDQEQFNQEEFLKKVEEAAERGAKKVRPRAGLMDTLKFFLTVAILGAVVLGFVNMRSNWTEFGQKMTEFTKFDFTSNHDTVLKDGGVFGFTAADFAEAVLGDASELTVLEVYKREVSDVATLTDAGFAGWKVFSKSQLITYHGTAIYTVDMSKLSDKNFSVDTENKIVHLTIPNVQLEPVNIDERNIEFADPTKGLLAFGDLTATAEQIAKVQEEARKKMEEKLALDNEMAEAEKFAELSIWKLYQPLVNACAPGYMLEVHFE